MISMSDHNTRASSFLLFLLGLGSATKIYFLGTIAFSELVIFCLAPIIWARNLQRMKREGFLQFIWMLVFLTLGLLVSAWWNHSPIFATVKCCAIFYGYFSYYVVFYVLLRNNLKGLGWFYLGALISGIITIWFFNPRADVSSVGFVRITDADAESIIKGPLFWIGKVRGLGELPIIFSYFKTPIVYSLTTPVLFAIFALLSSMSGRAQSMCVLLGGLIMFIGKKSRISMRRIGKHIVVLGLAGIVALATYKVVYSYAARNGYLSEEARNKYEHQTERGSDVISLLVAGRTEFFIALTAIIDHPIVGFGPRAVDAKGYTERFLLKYGTDEDIAGYNYGQMMAMRYGLTRDIPTHSHIMAGWLWCGLPGLIFFAWVIVVMYKHLRYYSSAIPQWFGYFALTIPSMLWGIFFNPFGARWYFSLLMTCLFFARAVGRGKIFLSYDMELEARRYE